MRYRYSGYLHTLLFISDLLLLNLSFVLGYYFSFGKFDGSLSYPFVNLLIYSNLSWVVLSILGKPFEIRRTSRVSYVVRHILRFVLIHLLSVSALMVFNLDVNYSRETIIYSYSIFLVLLLLQRLAFIYSIRIYRKYGFNYRNIIIVGYGDIAEEIKKFLRVHPEYGYKFLGFFDNSKIKNITEGKISDIEEFTANNRVDEIYCCLPELRYSQLQKLIHFGEKNFIKVKLIADFRGFEHKGLEIESYDNIPVLNVTSFPLEVRKNKFVKRSFDIAFSTGVILFIFSWLFPLIALAIKIDSKGPIFFKQRRTGKSNNNFWCWKFRTMVENKKADVLQAVPNDERVTFIGNFLRKTSLDELPQFFNVLIGNMSVVGPRPHMLHHTKEYSKKVERFMARHFVKPGITGLAQAKGYRGETTDISFMKNRVKLDRFYIENWSIVLDLKIILLTISSLLKGDENAY